MKFHDNCVVVSNSAMFIVFFIDAQPVTDSVSLAAVAVPLTLITGGAIAFAIIILWRSRRQKNGLSGKSFRISSHRHVN